MRNFIFLFVTLLFMGSVFSQDRLLTPNSEVEDAIKYLVGTDKDGNYYVNKLDKPYIRFFSTYAIQKEEDRNKNALVCSFVLHSLVGPAKDLDSNNAGAFYPIAKMEDVNGKKLFIPINKVPFSNTLWWIDLRNYNFTPEAWEVAAGLDAYFTLPIVQEQNNGSLRLEAGGNAILRMDWFNTHATDTARQRDVDKQFDIYNTFLFAQVQPPKNIKEWQAYFNLDIDKARVIGNEYGTIVTKSEQVARHNRMLFGYKTELGYMYDTYDVKNQEGLRDYFEGFFKNKIVGVPPDKSDAGEVFGTNQLGLQVYALRDGAGKLINFGDPTVVRHLADVFGDNRVRVAHSCIDCHAAGPLPAENTNVEFVRANGDLYLNNKSDKNRVNRVFLDGRFEDSIYFNKELFAKAVKKANGLTPEDNRNYYIDVVEKYCQNVDMDRAAFECGVNKQELLDKIDQNKFGGRLKLLKSTGETIPIDIWETRGADGIPGQFQQAMIIINGLTKITDQYVAEVKKNSLTTIENCDLMVKTAKLAIIPKNTILEVLETQLPFYKVEYEGKTGWVEAKKVKMN